MKRKNSSTNNILYKNTDDNELKIDLLTSSKQNNENFLTDNFFLRIDFYKSSVYINHFNHLQTYFNEFYNIHENDACELKRELKEEMDKGWKSIPKSYMLSHRNYINFKKIFNYTLFPTLNYIENIFFIRLMDTVKITKKLKSATLIKILQNDQDDTKFLYLISFYKTYFKNDRLFNYFKKDINQIEVDQQNFDKNFHFYYLSLITNVLYTLKRFIHYLKYHMEIILQG